MLDTLYPYGPTGGGPMTEQTPWRATAAKGRMRAALDEGYLAAHADGRVGVVLGRAADFYGPEVLSSSLGGAVFAPLLAGGPAMALGDPGLPHSYSYIGDVAAGLALLGATPGSDGRVWHLPTAPARTTSEIHRLIEELSARRVAAWTCSTPCARGGRSTRRSSPSTKSSSTSTSSPRSWSPSAFEARFGVSPTPLREGLRATLGWYQQHLAAAA